MQQRRLTCRLSSEFSFLCVSYFGYALGGTWRDIKVLTEQNYGNSADLAVMLKDASNGHNSYVATGGKYQRALCSLYASEQLARR